MSLGGSYLNTWPELVVLFWKAVKVFHEGALLEEGDSWGQALRFIASSYFLSALCLLTAYAM